MSTPSLTTTSIATDSVPLVIPSIGWGVSTVLHLQKKEFFSAIVPVVARVLCAGQQQGEVRPEAGGDGQRRRRFLTLLPRTKKKNPANSVQGQPWLGRAPPSFGYQDPDQAKVEPGRYRSGKKKTNPHHSLPPRNTRCHHLLHVQLTSPEEMA